MSERRIRVLFWSIPAAASAGLSWVMFTAPAGLTDARFWGWIFTACAAVQADIAIREAARHDR